MTTSPDPNALYAYYSRVFHHQTAVRRTDEWNAERRRKRLRIGQNSFCHEAAARLKSCLLFYLGNEGKRRFTDSNLHLNHKVGSLENFHDAFEALFQIARDYTVEQIKLYSTIFMLETDSFSSFLARIASGSRARHFHC